MMRIFFFLMAALALAALPASAQITTCYTNPGKATIASFGTLWQVNTLPSGRAWQIAFTSSGASATYSFSTCGTAQDTKLRLYNSSSTLLYTADNDGPHCTGTAASADWTGLAAGTYYILITRADCQGLTADLNFSFKSGTPVVVPTYTTCAITQSLEPTLSFSTSWQSRPATASTTHVYPFASNSLTDVHSFSTCGASNNTKLRLYNAAGSVIASVNDDGPHCTGMAASADWTSLPAGPYYVLLSNNDCSVLTSPVTFNYKRTGGTAALVNTCAAAPVFNTQVAMISAWQPLTLPPGNSYIIPFSSAGTGMVYSFRTCASGIDTKLRVYNSASNMVYSLDDYGPYCNSNAASADVTGLSAGTYYLLLTASDCNALASAVTLEYKEAVASGVGARQLAELKVYPNPARHQLYIENAAPGTALSLHNALGQQVQQAVAGTGAISMDLAPLPAGIYSLHARADGQVHGQRIVIE